jgi:hypothetical protein
MSLMSSGQATRELGKCKLKEISDEGGEGGPRMFCTVQ